MVNTEDKNLNKEDEAYLERETEEMDEHINPDAVKNPKQTSGSDNANCENITEELEVIEANEQQQITILEQKVAELKDLYVRAQAEVQNVQRRCTEDVKKARDYSISSFAKDIITVKDYLEMALKDQSGNFETLKTGVTMSFLKRIFTDHPHSIGETYFLHMKHAMCFGVTILLAGLACMIHAIIPCLFVTTASQTIKRLALKFDQRKQESE